MVLMRMGRPGLLGSGRPDRGHRRHRDDDRQRASTGTAQQRHAEQQAYAERQGAQSAQAYAPPPPAPPETDLVSQLARLARLRDAGVLTKEEFHTAKAELLSG